MFKRNRATAARPRPGDVAISGHVKFGPEWPTVGDDPDDRVSVLADQRARSRLLYDELLGGRWSLPHTWTDS